MSTQRTSDIKNYRRRLLRHHQTEFEIAAEAAKEGQFTEEVDWPRMMRMTSQLTGDIGKDQTEKLLRRLADLTGAGAFLSFSKTDLTEI
ncbi:MAG: hypothetical protein KG075_04880 [Alphaproteobacteria bacterium]|nr:hypothetical protein [Alphaproteobacteria bacterium]